MVIIIIIVYGGRGKKDCQMISFDGSNKCVGKSSHAAEEMYTGAKHTLANCRKFCWIMRGKELSKEIVKNCQKYKIQKAKCVTPVIGDLTGVRIKASETFSEVQLDLCGPMKVLKPGVRTRKAVIEKSTWILLAICQ